MEQKEEAETHAPPERGPVPLADSELLRRDHDPRRGERVPLRVPGHQGPPAVRAGGARRPPLDRLRAPRGPRYRPSKLLGGEISSHDPGTATLEFRMLRKDGTTRDVEAVVSNQTDRPSVAGYVANIRDVTERKKFEALLALPRPARPADGLANRQLILDRAQQMLVRARRSGRAGGGAVHRPGQLQGLQRLARPRRRRPVAADGRRAPARHSALGRHGRPARRRRVRDSGRGRLVRPAGPR